MNTHLTSFPWHAKRSYFWLFHRPKWCDRKAVDIQAYSLMHAMYVFFSSFGDVLDQRKYKNVGIIFNDMINYIKSLNNICPY